MCKVTVIVPNFNHAKYLERRLESISKQTYNDFELIILDDASTDKSLQVISSFTRNFHAKVIVNAINSGSPFKQWNLGVQHASGKYIWLAEADDDAEPDFLARLVNKLESNPQVVLAYCDSQVIDNNGLYKERIAELQADINESKWASDYTISGKTECSEFLVFRNIIPNASGVVFRRDIFLKVGGACENMKLSGDWMTWVKILMLGDVSYTSEALNYFRTHTGSVRHRTTARVGFEEALHIRSFIKSKLDVPPHVLNLVALSTRREWEQALWRAESVPSIAWFYKILVALRQFGPNGIHRMVRTYAFIKLARMPVLSRIKHFLLGSRNSPKPRNSRLRKILEALRGWTR